MSWQTPIAFDTLEIVGREKEKAAILQALATSNASRAILLRGPGGIGKTRLLRWAVEQALSKGMLCSGIIDLYHSKSHSNSGIENAILVGVMDAGNGNGGGNQAGLDGGIDPHNSYFQEYRKLREEFRDLRDEGVAVPRLEQLRLDLRKAFVKNYNALAEQQRIVLVIDTAELIQFESDVVQHICEIQEGAVEVKSWLTTVLPQLQDTVILLAGRGPRPDRERDPRARLWADLVEALGNTLVDPPYDLDTLDSGETSQYFDAVAMVARGQADKPDLTKEQSDALRKAAKQIEEISKEDRDRIHRSTEGRPVRLGLAIDLLCFDYPAELLLRDRSWSELAPLIVDRLEHLEGDEGRMFAQVLDYLACTRQGLSVDLLHHLEPSWDTNTCQQRLTIAQALSFVKSRRGSNEVFLHDSMYDLLEEHKIRYQPDRFYDYYDRIVSYFLASSETNEAASDTALLPDDSQVALLHYKLRRDPRDGYEFYFRRDELAIKGRQTGLDMKLRDEALRHLDDPDNERQAEQRGWPRGVINRDCSVRWIKRHLARNDIRSAAVVAETIMALGPSPYFSLVPDLATTTNRIESLPPDIKQRAFALFAGDNPYHWAHLLTYYAEALLYLSRPEEQVLPILKQATDLLGNGHAEPADGFQKWLRARILGRAHNNLGYLHRTRGRYGEAQEQYKMALPQFVEAGIQDEEADTRNNLAFLLALLGRVDIARPHVDRAMEIRQRIGQQYPLALSKNTRGLILTYEDQPSSGIKECQEALRTCENLREPRGRGLASLGLGFALRKRGDQWKLGESSASFKDAEGYFEEAVVYLKQAVDIFRDDAPEPLRLWEALNELGSTHCDWGIVAIRRDETAKAKELYDNSVDFQLQSIAIARMNGLTTQLAESYDDLAQVWADRGEFEKAEECLEVVEGLIPKPFLQALERGALEDAPRSGDFFWISAGKMNLQRAIWAFRQVERDKPADDERRERLDGGIRHFALAAAYFQHYWPRSNAFGVTLRSFAKYLVQAGVTAEQAHLTVVGVAEDYTLDLSPVLETIDDVLGV